jgi:hypothetical protein
MVRPLPCMPLFWLTSDCGPITTIGQSCLKFDLEAPVERSRAVWTKPIAKIRAKVPQNVHRLFFGVGHRDFQGGAI